MKNKVLILNPNGYNVLLVNPSIEELSKNTQMGATVVENPNLKPFKGHPIEHLKQSLDGSIALKSEEEIKSMSKDDKVDGVDLNAFKAFLEGSKPEPIIKEIIVEKIVEKVIPVEVEGKPPREIEVIKEVIKEVPVEKIVIKEVVKTEQVAVVANPTVITKEVPVEVVKEVIKHKTHKLVLAALILESIALLGLLIKG